MQAVAAPYVEVPLLLASPQGPVFGVLDQPVGEANGIAVTLVPGSVYPGASHRNRMFVRLARALAAHGFHTFRFDWRDTGISAGGPAFFRLDRPFSDEILAAHTALVERGLRRHIVVGTCFGGRTALANVERLDGLCGLVSVSTPLEPAAPPPEADASDGPAVRSSRIGDAARRVMGVERAWVYRHRVRSAVRRLRDRFDRRATPSVAGIADDMAGAIDFLVRNQVPQLILYGSDDTELVTFEQARAGGLDELLHRAGSLVEIDTFPGRLHGFDSLPSQQYLIDTVSTWIVDRSRRFDPEG
jgi:pimeloyl-ACP methyl ester carboxylesterase